MSRFAIITENDESEWEDKTGVVYHFPKRYARILEGGTSVIYYKGRERNPVFANRRLSDQPHYFATAKIGQIWPDPNSKKNDQFAAITDFRAFSAPVMAKLDGQYLEQIPSNRRRNYWYDGVRSITEPIFAAIRSRASLVLPDKSAVGPYHDDDQGTPSALQSYQEGTPTQKYVTTYERDPRLRKAAIAIHGTICKACNINFADVYGVLGKGYIHIHHCRPVSTLGSAANVNAVTDLAPLCPNCHAMIHRRRDLTLTIEQLKIILTEASAVHKTVP